MKMLFLVTVVSVFALPSLARAEATPQQIAGATIMTCVAGGSAGATIGWVLDGAHGVKSGAAIGCAVPGMFVFGLGLANAAEDGAKEADLNDSEQSPSSEE